MANPLRALPAVTTLLQDPRLADQPHELVVQEARAALDAARARLRAGAAPPMDLAAEVLDRVLAARRPQLRRVINATGIVLHTNLGRAPLAPEAVAHLVDVAGGYCNVEMDLGSGKRGGRLAGVRGLLCRLTGAEDALVVNNNAAAVLLCLSALAAGRGVLTSRGELVEIGGSFRIPDVVSAGGARLVEVGTTNRTRVADFEAAVDADAAVLLRVHPSNFRMQGFTERPERSALAALARARNVLLVEDLGSGLLGSPPVAGAGLEAEEVGAALAEGADLVCFSGDKLLGGPQAGIILGRAEWVARLRKHPLYRALRCDKLVLAALEGTLALYRDGRTGGIPAQRALRLTDAQLKARAQALAAQLPGSRVRADEAFSGGGALPAVALPAWVVVLPSADPSGDARRLRQAAPPVIARVARDQLLLDPRTLLPGEDATLVAVVRDLLCDTSAATE